MPYLIDGHNLIGRLHPSRLSDPEDERWLLERLASLASGQIRKMIVFFDGDEPGAAKSIRRCGSVEARFVARPASADSAILRYLRNRKDPGNFTVVTSDRELANRACRTGARVLSAEAFLHAARSAQDRARKEKPPGNPEEIDEWLTLFGERQVGPDGLEPSTHSL